MYIYGARDGRCDAVFQIGHDVSEVKSDEAKNSFLCFWMCKV
jgi:hypothetical protein